MTTEITTLNFLESLANKLSSDIEPVTVAITYGQLKLLEDNIKDVIDVARARVLEIVKQHGSPITENGTLQARLGDYTVEATVRNTGYDPKKVHVLLRHKRLEPEAGMDATVTYKPSMDKLSKLVAEGLLDGRELELCRFDREYNLKRPVKVSDGE